MQSIVEHVRSIAELRDDEVSVYTSAYPSNGQTEIQVATNREHQMLPEQGGGMLYVTISARVISTDPEVAAAEAEWLRGVLLERRRAS